MMAFKTIAPYAVALIAFALFYVVPDARAMVCDLGLPMKG